MQHEHAAPADRELAVEVERLRVILDRQPSCLMRVGVDGTLFAVSDVALSLLGGRPLAKVLDTSLIERLEGDGEALWSDFVRRVVQAGSASLECEMNDLDGMRRAVLLQGVSLPAHPDGDSLLVTVRDVSAARRLQASLLEQENLRRTAQDDLQKTSEQMRTLQARFDEVTAERQQLRAALDAALAERHELSSALTQLKIALGTAIDSTLLVQQVVQKGAHQ